MQAGRVDVQRAMFVMNEKFIEAYAAQIINDLMNTYGDVQVYVKEQAWQ